MAVAKELQPAPFEGVTNGDLDPLHRSADRGAAGVMPAE
jgi:hypothetical protein